MDEQVMVRRQENGVTVLRVASVLGVTDTGLRVMIHGAPVGTRPLDVAKKDTVPIASVTPGNVRMNPRQHRPRPVQQLPTAYGALGKR